MSKVPLYLEETSEPKLPLRLVEEERAYRGDPKHRKNTYI